MAQLLQKVLQGLPVVGKGGLAQGRFDFRDGLLGLPFTYQPQNLLAQGRMGAGQLEFEFPAA